MKKLDTCNIGQRIRERREELSMSQEELAKRIGYKSRSTINKIEMGKNDIPQSKIEKFSKALNIPPVILMGWDYIIHDNLPKDLPDLSNLKSGENHSNRLRDLEIKILSIAVNLPDDKLQDLFRYAEELNTKK